MLVGLLVGFLVTLIAGLHFGLLHGLVNGLLGGFIGGFWGGLIGGFDGLLHRKGRKLDSFTGGAVNATDAKIRPVENVTWSWKFTFTRQRLVTGLIAMLVVGLIGWLTSDLNGTISIVLTVMFIYWLINCFSTDELPERTVPNEGIWRSGKNGLAIGLLVGLIAGLVGGITTAALPHHSYLK